MNEKSAGPKTQQTRSVTKRVVLIVTVVVICCFLDRITKIWASNWLLYHGPVHVVQGIFALRYAENTGIAFGMFARYGIYVQRLSPIIFLGLLIFFFTSSHFKGMYPLWQDISFGLIIGGALGNLYDRMVYKYVVDFIDWYIGRYHWPTFNLADSFICVGVTILMVITILTERKEKQMRQDS